MRDDCFAHVANECESDYLIQPSDHNYDILDASHQTAYWFMIPSPAIRYYMSDQLAKSKRTTRVLYLGAKLVQALNQESHHNRSTFQGYIDWIDKLEERLITYPCNNRLQSDTRDCLMAHLKASQ
jgi:hypothetical protein